MGRYLKTREDKSFQAFKAIFLPVRKKPGPKPKAVHASNLPGAQA